MNLGFRLMAFIGLLICLFSASKYALLTQYGQKVDARIENVRVGSRSSVLELSFDLEQRHLKSDLTVPTNDVLWSNSTIRVWAGGVLFVVVERDIRRPLFAAIECFVCSFLLLGMNWVLLRHIRAKD